MVQIKPVGDCGALVELGDSISEELNAKVMELNRRIHELSVEGILETVPAFCSVLVCYDPLKTDYDGKITEEEVIRVHSSRDYRIYMLGFLPGFPYLGGMDERIFTPRLNSPRTRIPAGSVGIGGEQTGIYPMDSPGGWQLIGRTPYCLFKPEQVGKPLYEAGDSIRFVPISKEEYKEIKRKQEKG